MGPYSFTFCPFVAGIEHWGRDWDRHRVSDRKITPTPTGLFCQFSIYDSRRGPDYRAGVARAFADLFSDRPAIVRVGMANTLCYWSRFVDWDVLFTNPHR